MLRKIKIKFYKTLYAKLPAKYAGFLGSKIAKLDGGEMYSMNLREVYEAKFKVKVGYGSYGGCFVNKQIPKGVKFGNYCSIAKEIRIFRANHPRSTFTTHPLVYNPVAGYVKKDMLERPELEIGHDVWIGEWVTILPHVKKIGNGAMIGAGAIVTKDVAPFTIIAGNPAKKIGDRFTAEQVAKIEETQWWLLNVEELKLKIDFLNNLING